MSRKMPPRMLGPLPATDVLLAGALAVFAVGGLLTGAVQEAPLAVTLPIAIASTLPLALRTRFPLCVASLVVLLSIVQALATGSPSGTLWSLLVFLVVAYTVAAERREGGALAGLAVVLGGQFAGEVLVSGNDYAFDTLVFGGAWLCGRATHKWRSQAMATKAHEQELARVAVVAERARIARELHDIVAHSLSEIAIQSDAAEAVLARAPERAAAPMLAIRSSARNALVDMRQLLQVLRDEGTDPQLQPTRGMEDVPGLVEGFRTAGLPVEFSIRVRVRMPAGIELAVFRILQEGLTNVRNHAGNVPTRVLVIQEGLELRIEVHNAGPSGSRPRADRLSTGHGLLGIRERVQAAGGVVETGPTCSGGYSLVSRIPLAGGLA